MTNVQLHTEFWQEGDLYVAYVPQLDVSSCGKTVEEAKDHIREAVEAFLEEADKMGTLNDILEEAGFVFDKTWKAPPMVLCEQMQLTV